MSGLQEQRSTSSRSRASVRQGRLKGGSSRVRSRASTSKDSHGPPWDRRSSPPVARHDATHELVEQWNGQGRSPHVRGSKPYPWQSDCFSSVRVTSQPSQESDPRDRRSRHFTRARRSPEILTTRAARRRALACSPGIPEPPLGCCRALRASFGPGCGIPAALDNSPPPNRPRLSRTSPTAATARRSCAWPQACPNDGADAFRDQDARAGLEAGAPVRGGLEAGVPLGTAHRSTARQGASGRSGRRRLASRAWRCRRRQACPNRGRSTWDGGRGASFSPVSSE